MKIGIFFSNKSINHLDYSTPEIVNPGISGTMIQVALLIKLYPLYYPEAELIQFTDAKSKLISARNVIVSDEIDAIRQASFHDVDFFIMNTTNSQEVHSAIEEFKLKTIFWAQNYYFADLCNRIHRNRYIVQNVFAGRQVYDRYIDHDIIIKSTFIFNMSSTPPVSRISVDFHSPNITYIGAIVPSKGFHVLAKIWPKIIRKYPTAVLNIIGSAGLHGYKSGLGTLGIADEDYEQKIRHYLTGKDGVLLESVKIHGLIGQKLKSDIINRSIIGVINPTGRTENCPVSGIDFALHGVPVVTKYKNGSIDVLLNKSTGLFFYFDCFFKRKIFTLIENKNLNDFLSINASLFAKKRFDQSVIIREWNKLFTNVYNGELPEYISPTDHFLVTFKLLELS
jgi:glycosyltransferase involved in cell wall biosynthesis